MDVVLRYLHLSFQHSIARLPIVAIALFMGGLLWVGSLWSPAVYTEQGEVLGYWLLITGWMGFAVFQFGWYANLVMLLGVLLMNHCPKRSVLMAVFGVLLASQSFWLHVLPGDEANLEVVHRGAGFWMWYGSMLLLGLGILFGVDEQRRASRKQNKKAGVIKQTPADSECEKQI